jgi:hypothetical protein
MCDVGETLSSKFVSARNTYNCDFCGCFILKGQIHRSDGILFERSVSQYRIHADCDLAIYLFPDYVAPSDFIYPLCDIDDPHERDEIFLKVPSIKNRMIEQKRGVYSE